MDKFYLNDQVFSNANNISIGQDHDEDKQNDQFQECESKSEDHENSNSSTESVGHLNSEIDMKNDKDS